MSGIPADLTGLQQAFPYPRSSTGATTDLAQALVRQIRQSGPISFQDYMAQCLYHPELGYYSRPQARTVSKEGDFMTSVSVGPVFGTLLARRLHRFWQENGSPSRFRLLEPGAHDGSLALDVLKAALDHDPTFAAALEYLIIEPLTARHPLLQDRLGDRATIVTEPPNSPTELGAVLANELFDALPVPLFLKTAPAWLEVMVTAEDDQLTWAARPADPNLPPNLPEGYVTEGPPDFDSFLRPLAASIENGLLIFIDYGLDQETLYHPARTAGTLRCYRKHQTKTHPLDHPGEQDLTSDVNFTAVTEVAQTLGLAESVLMNQSRYLTYCGQEWLLTGPSGHEISQFQTLIHPSQFGNRFYALELTKGQVANTFP